MRLKPFVYSVIVLVSFILLMHQAFANTNQTIILLEDNVDALLWIDASNRTISKNKKIPDPGAGPFVGFDLDENENVYILQEIQSSEEGRVIFYNNDQDEFHILSTFKGSSPEWWDIVCANDNNILLLNATRAGNPDNSSSIYNLAIEDKTQDTNPVYQIGILKEPTENDASDVFKIRYFSHNSFQGVWCLETDGPNNGEDIFFFQITNWSGTEGNGLFENSNRIDIGRYGENSNRSDVKDFELDKDGNLILLEQDNAINETSYVGHNYADDLYRLPITYTNDSISLGSEVLISEWPNSYSADEGITEIQMITVDKGTGKVYGIDKDDIHLNDVLYCIDGSIPVSIHGYTGSVDIAMLSSEVEHYTSYSSGIINEDTTWSGNLNIQGDIRVSSGSTLTILAGAKILFAYSDDQSGGNDNTKSELIIENGCTLNIEGTIEKPVLLSSVNQPAAQGDWGGIWLDYSSARQVLNISNCKIEGAKHGIHFLQNGGFSTINLHNVDISRHSDTGLYVKVLNAGQLTFDLSSSNLNSNHYCSRFASNASYGIFIHAENSGTIINTSIKSALFENNVRSGLLLYAHDQTELFYTIENNLASGHTNSNDWAYGNGLGVFNHYRCQNIGTFINNKVHNNRIGIYRYNHQGREKEVKTTIESNIAKNNILAGIFYYHYYGYGSDVIIKNNTVSHTLNGPGIKAYRHRYHNSGLLSVHFEGNIVHENKGNGIDSYWDHSGNIQLTASNNYCYSNNNHGMYLKSTTTTKLESNICAFNKTNGIWVMSPGTKTLVRNQVYQNLANGFYIDGGGPLELVYNESYQNSAHGVQLGSVSQSAILFNYIYENQKDGIQIKSNAPVYINYNNIYDNHIQADCYAINNLTNYIIDARYNYFGMNDDLEQVIYDHLDNAASGPVNINNHQENILAFDKRSIIKIKDPINDQSLNDDIEYMIHGVAFCESENYTIALSMDSGESWQTMPCTNHWSASWDSPYSGTYEIQAKLLGDQEAIDTVSGTIQPDIPTTSGIIKNYEEWNGLTQGEITINGDVIVKSNASLIIQAGTVVKFEHSDRTLSGDNTSYPEIIVDGGSIIFNGTEENPIVFTSKSKQEKGMWGGITIRQDSNTITPLNLSHVEINSGLWGIKCTVSGWDDYSHQKSIKMEHLYVHHVDGIGLDLYLDGGIGHIQLSQILCEHNSELGIYARTYNSSVWKANLTDIRCLYNGGSKHSGLYWSNTQASQLDLNMDSSENASESTQTAFIGNGCYGACFQIDNNGTVLTANISDGIYSANHVSGLYLIGQTQTIMNYDIQQNISANHTASNGWNYGNGICVYSYYQCQTKGSINNNTLLNNRYGIHRFINDVISHVETTIENNTISNSTTTGIYCYQEKGYGADLLIRNNSINGTTNGPGIDAYRYRYRNSSILNVELENNTSWNNKGRGIQSWRKDSGNIQIVARKNLCYDNGHDGLYVFSTHAPEVYSNTCYNNAQKGIWMSSGQPMKVCRNRINENVTGGIHIEGGGKLQFFFNECQNNGSDGIYLKSVAESDLHFNSIISNSGDGIEIHASDLVRMNYNNIWGNYSTDETFEINNMTSFPVDARFSYMGSTGFDPILVWDINDNVVLGEINSTNSLDKSIKIPKDSVSKITYPTSDQLINTNTHTINGIALSDTNPFTIQCSTDNGLTWNDIAGDIYWNYQWIEPAQGSYTILAKVKTSQYTPDKIVITTTDTGIPTTCGTLSTNEIWDSNIHGNIMITGDVIIPEGKSLSIVQGTTIKFTTSDQSRGGEDKNKPEIIVDGGELFINGTSTNSVRFTSIRDNQSKGLWGGITISQNNETNKPLHIKHAVIEYASWGLKYTLSGWNDPQYTKPIDIKHLHVHNVSGNGLEIQLNGGTGKLQLSQITSELNFGHGMYVHTYNQGLWDANLVDIRCLTNGNFSDGSFGQSGLYWYHEQNSLLNFILDSSENKNEDTQTAFVGNDCYGFLFIVEDKGTFLSASASHGLYSANAVSGFYLVGYNETTMNYSIDNNSACNHTKTNGWNYGNGICVYSHYNCQTEGKIFNNILQGNRYGIHRYNNDGINQIKTTIENNTIYQSNTCGVYYYQKSGYGAYLTIKDNYIQNSYTGIDAFREGYRNSAILYIELSHNTSFNNSQRGIQAWRRNSGNVQITAHHNTCFDNGHDGLYVYASSKAIVYKNILYNNVKNGLYYYSSASGLVYGNHIHNNKGYGIEFVSDALSDVIFNRIYENGNHGIFSNCKDIANINYNNIYNHFQDASIFELYNKNSKQIDARYNYFGENSEIDLIIFDKNDDNSKGYIDYQNFSSMPMDLTIVNEKIMIKDPTENVNEVIPVSPYIIRGVAVCETGIKRVEVQVEEGGDWYPAVGTNHWQYEWGINRPGSFHLKARIIDDQNSMLTNSNSVSLSVSSMIPTTSGILSKDEIWNDEHGPILVTGDVTIPSDKTLIIKPGTQILFAVNDDRQAGANKDLCELIVNEGTLIIEGTAQKPITLTTSGNIELPGQWGGIEIHQTGNANLIFRHCKIEFSAKGLHYSFEGGNGNIVIENIEINQTSGDGIYLDIVNLTGNININDISLYNNGGYGIATFLKGGSGDFKLSRSIANNNNSDGFHTSVSEKGNWDVLIENVISNNNNSYGILINSKSGAYVNAFIGSNESFDGYSKTTANNNKNYGIYNYVTDNSSFLQTHINNIYVESNEATGIMIFGRDDTTLKYRVENCESVLHTVANEWYHGNGICVYSYQKCKLNGSIVNNIVNNNRVGFRYYNRQKNQVEDHITILEKNSFYENNYGIYYYQESGYYTSKCIIKENEIINSKDQGITVYRNSNNDSHFLIAELVKNIITGSGKDGIYIRRHNSPNVILYAFLNSITENGEDGIDLNTSHLSYLFYNDIHNNGLNHMAVRASSGASINARWNYWGDDITQLMESNSNPQNLTAIHDVFDSSNLGSVQYPPWLSNPNAITSTNFPFSRIIDPMPDETIHGGERSILGFASCSNNLDHIDVSMDNGQTWQQAEWIDDNEMIFWKINWDDPPDGEYQLISQAITTDGIVENQPYTTTIFVLNNAPTTSGHLSSDEIWSGTINIKGDIIIPEGIGLTIKPGTVINIPPFQDFTGLNHHSQTEIIVNGVLIAMGTEEDRILFTSSTENIPGSWRGIKITGNLEMQYVDVMHAINALEIEGIGENRHLNLENITLSNYTQHGIYSTFSKSAHVEFNLFNSSIDGSGSQGYGVYCKMTDGSDGYVYLNDSQIIHTGNAGVYLYQQHTNPIDIRITGCKFKQNAQRGVYVYTDGNNNNNSPTKIDILIQNNQFDNNKINGLFLYNKERTSCNALIKNNQMEQIYGDSVYAIRVQFDYSATGDNRSKLNIENNYIDFNQNGIDVYAYYSTLEPVIKNNQILHSNDTGLFLRHNNSAEFIPSIHGNRINDNTKHNIHINTTNAIEITSNELGGDSPKLIALYNNSAHNIDAQNNWWGFNRDKEAISELIYDKNDNTNKGEVLFEPWVDQFEPPDSPILDQNNLITNHETYTITGTKPTQTGIMINGENKINITPEETWAASINLNSGINLINVYAINENNYVSEPVILKIILDRLAPELFHTDPSNDSEKKRVEKIVITLLDRNGTIDDELVKQNIKVKNSQSQFIQGKVTESNDQFIFIPDHPLNDDFYSVSIMTADTAGNSESYSFTFLVDTTVPEKPSILGGNITSGLIKVRPFDGNYSDIKTIEISGSRSENTSIWMNGEQKSDYSSENWSVELSLNEGLNVLEIWAADKAGNKSISEWIDIYVDTVAPVIKHIYPSNNSFLNYQLDKIKIDYIEDTSGLSLIKTIKSLKDSDNFDVDGLWQIENDNQLVFIPTYPLTEFDYTLEVKLIDNVGKQSAKAQYDFTIDLTPPTPPVINEVISPTNNATQVISGTKAPYVSIQLNDKQIVGLTSETNWQHTLHLMNGVNHFVLYSIDKANNKSNEISFDIIYDDIAPASVDQLVINEKGDGNSVVLDWSDYDEGDHGDISYYRIYASDQFFTQVTDLQINSTTSSGKKNAIVNNLIKGKTYYFAVTAVDKNGNARNSVTPVSATPVDMLPPGEVNNLIVSSFNNKLSFHWELPQDNIDDLAGYNLYFSSASDPIVLTSGQTRFDQDQLNDATAYTFKISTFDHSNNESQGISITAVTLLPNPGIVSTSAHSGYFDIQWKEIHPLSYVKHYSIYVHEESYYNTSDLTPRLNTKGNHAKIAGLTNDQTYYVAVTTLNISNGENYAVTTTTITPVPDRIGPKLSNINLNNEPIEEQIPIKRYADISLNAIDSVGIANVEFYIDETHFHTDSNGSNYYSCQIDALFFDDGIHSLNIKAFDTLGNETEVSYTLNIALEPPSSPTILIPNKDQQTNQSFIMISGKADTHTDVIFLNNGKQTGININSEEKGAFSANVPLNEGENQIQAFCQNRSGQSKTGNIRIITLDSSVPGAPTHVLAESKSDGIIRLAWDSPSNISVKGFNLYRSTAKFDTKDNAEKLNENLITGSVYDDLPNEDGTYYYRATLVNHVNSESLLSDSVSEISDRERPKASTIQYIPKGEYDEVSGRFGCGIVNILLTVNEPLLFNPFLSINIPGSLPVSVELKKENNLIYSGFFVISSNMSGGTGYAVFSSRDLAGNRGTTIEEGKSLQIDTSGPSITYLRVQPDSPIRNFEDTPVRVRVIVGLNETIAFNQTPDFYYLLSGEGREPTPMDSFSRMNPLEGQADTWKGTFELPIDAGLNALESFKFIYKGIDDLNNASERILCDNIFQVYQGDLPPLPVPESLALKALPKGQVKLTWEMVENASGYQIYRQGPEDLSLAEYQRVNDVLEFIDQTNEDGSYLYGVASIREFNDQEAISESCVAKEIRSDSNPPATPENFKLELIPQGIKASWNPNTDPDFYMYHLYRSHGNEILSVEGISPIKTHFKGTVVIDYHPSSTDHCYVLTAMDQIGNESEPSNSAYLNPKLMPVSSLHVLKKENELPVLSWTHPGGNDIAGFDLFIDAMKIDEDLTSNNEQYVDTGYAGKERQYTVVVKDTNNEKSLARSVSLPVINAVLYKGNKIHRNIMNRLEYIVENPSQHPLDSLLIKIKLNNIIHTSEPFSLSAQDTQIIPVILGGYADLPDISPIDQIIDISPDPGTQTEIIWSSELDVTDGMLVLGILNEPFIRGGTGSVRFTIENTGDEEIEIVTGTPSGSSNEVHFKLLDEDGNVITSKSYFEKTGENIITLSNGKTVARIQKGQIYTSQAVEMNVPSTAPDDLILELNVLNIYYRMNRPEEVKLKGCKTTRQISLSDTSYYGEVLSITPVTSYGDQSITITGRAIERGYTEKSMPDVPLKLTISVSGFERTYDIYTNKDGVFNYIFQPMTREYGSYKVWAVHPDVKDKPVQGMFTIKRMLMTAPVVETKQDQKPLPSNAIQILGFNPTVINLSIPRNYEQTLSINLTSGGEQAHNLRLVYNENNQPEGVFPKGVYVNLSEPIPLINPGEQAKIQWTIRANNVAGDSGKVVLTVVSDEASDGSLGSVVINTHFSEARPAVFFYPDHVETGVAHNDSAFETIVLENKGLADLNDVSLSFISSTGSSAPSWLNLNSDNKIETISVGESLKINMTFKPTEDIFPGEHFFYLKMNSSNHSIISIPIYITVTRFGEGHVLFKISDIYTGTFDKNNTVIEGLGNAKIYLQNLEVPSIEATLTTDNYGEAFFQDLTTGRYQCRISANNHQDYSGYFWIKPGITEIQEIFLDYNLVTVEWDVTEKTIEDKYEIILSTTYKTDVPAAVVVAEPTSLNLPEMNTGDIYYGEFTLTNYGLIRAKQIDFYLPVSSSNFKYEIMGGLPDYLDPKESMTIPYRVTCILSPNGEEDSSGGGCRRFKACIKVIYEFECSNGENYESSSEYCIFYDNGSCGLGISLPPIYIPKAKYKISLKDHIVPAASAIKNVVESFDQIVNPFISKKKPKKKPTSLEVKCFQKALRMEYYEEEISLKNSFKNFMKTVGCSVNFVLREFNDESTDLAVKVPGGSIQVKRQFYANQWHWEHLRKRLVFNYDVLGRYIESINKGGILYDRSSRDSDSSEVFTHKSYKIIRNEDGYRWKDKYGNWKDYDNEGRILSSGNQYGIISRWIYDDADKEKIIGLADKNDNQVINFEYNDENQIESCSDNNNRRVEYLYENQQLINVTDVLNNKTKYEYDTEGQLIKKTDTAGRLTLASYDVYGNVISVVDEDGNGDFFDYNYDEAKKESYAQIKTTSGRLTEIWYDKKGETKQVNINGKTVEKIIKDNNDLIIIDEKGKITRKDFDERDNLVKITYPDDTSVTFEYEPIFNKPVKITNAKGIQTIFEYDEQGNLTRKIEAYNTESERTATFTYNDIGQILTATIEADENTESSTTTFEYNEKGDLISITAPEGNVSKFIKYDNMGHLLQMLDPKENLWTFEYDQMGRMISQSNPLGYSTSYEYDAANNTTTIINAHLKRFEFEYDHHNNLIKVIDSYKKYSKRVYNTDHLLTDFIDEEGNEIHYKYDNEGRIKTFIDGAGNEINYFYDETQETYVPSSIPVKIKYPTFTRRLYYDKSNRVIRELDILGEDKEHSRNYEYDAIGNLIKLIDSENNSTILEYDSLNRLVKIIDSLNGVTEKIYDDKDNIIELIDANKGITRFQYDKNSNLIKIIQPMGQESNYEYDLNGNIQIKIDAKGQKIVYDYNELNQIIKEKHYSKDNYETPIKVIDYVYDKLGNLISYDDHVTSSSYIYDDLQRLSKESINYGSFTLANQYTYYANHLKESYTGPNNISYFYSYDANNRLRKINIPNKGSYIFNSYLWNRPVKTTIPGGTSTTYAYNQLMQLQSIEVKDPGKNALMKRSYEYSSVGNILSKQTEHGTYSYSYDQLYRMISAINPSSQNESYTYDLMANRLTSSNIDGTWQYNQNNELVSYDQYSYEYDLNGNAISKNVSDQEVMTYGYSINNRMIQIKDHANDQLFDYYYDPFGRRLWKDINGIRTYYFYANEGLVAEYDAEGNEKKSYGYLPNSIWSTDPIFLKIDENYYWFQNDYMGKPQKLIKENGQIVWEAIYDSFGNCKLLNDEITNNLRLPGQYFDSETGLHYNLNRYYDPQIGRYLRIDPFGDGTNLYVYVRSNPIGAYDPYGYCVMDVAGLFDPTPFSDFLGAIAYGLSGDYMQMGMSLVSGILPYVGDAIAKSWKLSKKFGKKFDDIADNLLPEPKYADGIGETLTDGAKQIDNIGNAPSSATKKPFALGIDDHLDDFAKQHGASTWKKLDDVQNWKPQVLDKLADPDQKVLFNLDGVDVWPGIQRSSAGRGGATDWELQQIYENPQFWDTIEFWKNGERVSNPFK